MSVPKSRRTQARTEYVWQATLLASEAGRVCSRLPKRWAFTRTRYILDAANRVMEEAVRANAVYATDEAEAAIRMGHLQEAMASAYVLEAYINQIAEDGPRRPCDSGKDYADQRPCVTPGQLAELCNRCASVERLVKAVIKADRAKWSRKTKHRRRPSRKSL